MKKTIEEIRKVTEKKIIIGGGVINQDWCDQVKADLWAKDAMDGVNKIRELLDV
ncbi:MAG: hypothetical protein ACTSSI_15080 [Candidatus Helarchaeota archaeon]